MPAVSVIIPAYNAERHIGDALASIDAQTMRDVDVVVVDDGSADRTVREVKRFADRLDVTIVCQTNAGPAAARNEGIRRARGRYCAFLDADDLMLPGRLEAQLARFEADLTLALVFTDAITFNEHGIIYSSRRAYSDPQSGMVLDRLLLDNFITTSTVMAPRSRLLEAGLFPENRRVSEDYELWLRMASQWPVAYIDEPLVQYRRRTGSLSDDQLQTARCGLDVVETFWREHADLRTRRSTLFRRSMAERLGVVGASAADRGLRATALRYLARSLQCDPWRRRTWKSVVKTFVRPASGSERGVSMGRVASVRGSR